MDFTSNSSQPQTVTPASRGAVSPGGSKKNKQNESKWVEAIKLLLAGALAVLLIALVAFIGFGGNNNEDKYVDGTKLQAVFLNTGQVYFGNIKTLNNKYVVLTNIYYLQTANNSGSGSSNQNTNVTLVKLGCELHEPYDRMIINKEQVTFWENLQDGGQVAKAVSTFEQQNPNGQKCTDQSSSSSNTSNSVQSAGSSNSSSSSSSSNKKP